MSWDFYLEIDAGGEDPAIIKDGLSYTYNVAPMYYDLFSSHTSKGIRWLDGQKASDAAPVLMDAIVQMRTDPAKYRKMNPPNGWGSYEGALRVLENLHTWCVEAPNGILRVS